MTSRQPQVARTKWRAITLAALVGCSIAACSPASSSRPAETAKSSRPRPNITLKHGSAPEQKTKLQLEWLLVTYDLSPWQLTSEVQIDEEAIPHSHPILTLHARHLRDTPLLLSTYIHEQSHWCLDQHKAETAAVVAELEGLVPGLPVGFPDGAMNHQSSYEHLMVIEFEWRGLKSLIGELAARQVMEFWATDHYRAIYRAVLSNDTAIWEAMRRHWFRVPSAEQGCYGDAARAG